MPFDVGSIKADLELDRTDFNRELQIAEQEARDFPDRITANLFLDASNFERTAREAQVQVEILEGLDAEIQITGDDSDLQAAALGSRSTIDQLKAMGADIAITGDDSRFQIAADRAKAAIEGLRLLSATITIDANTAPFDRAYADVIAKTQTLRALGVNVPIGGDNSGFGRADAATRNGANGLSQLRPTVPIGGNPANWDTTTRRVVSDINGLNARGPNIPFGANDSNYFNGSRRVRTDSDQINRMRPQVVFSAEARQALQVIENLKNHIDSVANAAALAQNAFGNDGTNTRRAGGLIGSILGLGPAIISTIPHIIGFVSAVSQAINMGGGFTAIITRLIGGFAGMIAGAGLLVVSLVALGAALGAVLVVLTAIAGILLIGVAWLGLFAGGLGLIALAALPMILKIEEAKAATDRLIAVVKGEFYPAFANAMGPATTAVVDLATQIVQTLTPALPALGTAASAATESLSSGFFEVMRILDGQGASQSLSGMLEYINSIVYNGTVAVGAFSGAFLGFLYAAGPNAERFGIATANAAVSLSEWANSEEGRAQIQEFLDAVVPIAIQLGIILWDVGAALISMAITHGPAIATFLGYVGSVMWFFVEATNAALYAVEFLIAAFQTFLALNPGNLAAYVSGDPNASDPLQPFKDYLGYEDGGDYPDEMARGGTVKKRLDPLGESTPIMAASAGMDVGAHYVTSPTMMGGLSQPVLYGEALAGGAREYAFPMEDTVRFITEDPGHDQNSYDLWKDLGQRKGYIQPPSDAPARPMTGPAAPAPARATSVARSTTASAARPDTSASSDDHPTRRRRRRTRTEMATIQVNIGERRLAEYVTEVVWDNIDRTLRESLA